MPEERLVAEIDAELKKKVDIDSRTNRQVTEVALRKELGDHRESVLDVRIEHKERQQALIEEEMAKRREQFEQEMQDYRRELEEIEAEKQELQAEKESASEVQDAEELYKNDLRQLFTEFANSRAVLPRFRSDAMDIADDHGKTLREIEQDIHDLADESEYEIDEDRWTDGLGEGLA